MLLTLVYVVGPTQRVWAEVFADLESDIVIDRELDTMRGGFTSSNGLEVFFGIEQAVFIDGIVQVATNFNTSSIATMVPQKVNELSTLTTNVETISSQLNTLVQNSQDQRVIDSITLINATVSNLGVFNQLNRLNSLLQQQINTLR